MSITLDALRTATGALLTTAPEPVVQRMLREVLNAYAADAVDTIAPLAPRRRRGMHPS